MASNQFDNGLIYWSETAIYTLEVWAYYTPPAHNLDW